MVNVMATTKILNPNNAQSTFKIVILSAAAKMKNLQKTHFSQSGSDVANSGFVFNGCSQCFCTWLRWNLSQTFFILLGPVTKFCWATFLKGNCFLFKMWFWNPLLHSFPWLKTELVHPVHLHHVTYVLLIFAVSSLLSCENRIQTSSHLKFKRTTATKQWVHWTWN